MHSCMPGLTWRLQRQISQENFEAAEESDIYRLEEAVEAG